MSKDPTFRVLGELPGRSERYQAYRREWDRRETDVDASDRPVHVDLESVATCDLRCGSSEDDPQGFCQIWTHEHIRTQGLDEYTFQRGFMDPILYGRLIQQCADLGVSSVKLNYRGEPSLHPMIVAFVREAAQLGFPDIMMNTNGNGLARKQPDLFAQDRGRGHHRPHVLGGRLRPRHLRAAAGGRRLGGAAAFGSSAVEARAQGQSAPDCRIRASVVRTRLNAADVDSGRMEAFWRGELGSTGCRSPSAISRPGPSTTGRRPCGGR